MAQSSVELLASKVQEHFYITDKDALYPIFQGWVNESKAMHQKEHEDAFIEGAKSFREGQAFTEQGFREISRIVYTETFGNETE